MIECGKSSLPTHAPYSQPKGLQTLADTSGSVVVVGLRPCVRQQGNHLVVTLDAGQQ